MSTCLLFIARTVSGISNSRSPGAEKWPLAGKSRAMKHRGLRQLLSVIVVVVVVVRRRSRGRGPPPLVHI